MSDEHDTTEVAAPERNEPAVAALRRVVAKLSNGGEPRRGQEIMVDAVENAIRTGMPLSAEAGTGTGKCLTGETLITLSDGSRHPISSLVGTTPEVAALNEDWTVGFRKAAAVFVSGEKPVLRMETRLGNVVRGSADHPVRTLTGWKRLGELQPGDSVASARNIPVAEGAALPEAELSFLALLIADGSCAEPTSLSYTKADPAMIDELRSACAALGNLAVTDHPSNPYNFGITRAPRVDMGRNVRNDGIVLLEQHGVIGKRPKDKVLPSAVMTLPEEDVAFFLGRLFSGDGTVDSRQSLVSYSTASHALAEQVKYLLLRLGVPSRNRYRLAKADGKEYDAWNVEVSGVTDIRRFAETAGRHLLGGKAAAFHALIERCEGTAPNPDDDLVPSAVWDMIDDARIAAGKSWYAIRQHAGVASSRTRSVSRQKLAVIADFLGDDRLRLLSSSDVYWDEVAAVTPDGTEQTYDITMTGDPNFLAGNVVVHNSIGYLVPTILSGKKTVVATATKALQDQLAQKDLPFLQEHLGVDFEFALLKGRSNYACFAGETRVLTPAGPVEIATLAGGTAVVMDGDGDWVDAPVASFGVQRLMVVALTDGETERHVHATAEHRWLLAPTEVGTTVTEFQTCDLRPGDVLHRVSVDQPEWTVVAIEWSDRTEEVYCATVHTTASFVLDGHVLTGNCPQKIDEEHEKVLDKDNQLAFDADSPADDEDTEVAKLIEWAESSPTGDRSELSFEPTYKAWARVSVGVNECPGVDRCPSGNRCFAEQAKNEAKEADVIVVNHHLYGSHARLDNVIPEHEIVVFDEAHELESCMTGAMGTEVGPRQLLSLAVVARKTLTGKGHDTPLREAADELAAVLAPLEGQRLRGGPAVNKRLFETLVSAAKAVEQTALKLKRASDSARSSGGKAKTFRAMKLAVGVMEAMEASLNPGDNEVCWIEKQGDFPVLRIAPIDIAPAMKARVWPKKVGIIASATMHKDAPKRLGLDAAIRVPVPSPFNYRANSILYVPQGLPGVKDPAFPEASWKEIAHLATVAEGRTMSLFTSHRAAQAAAAALRDMLPYRILLQGELPKPMLVEEFKNDESSVLVATTSFWQGVDLPGSTLSCVTIDKLPFPRPDDPVAQARRERAGDNWFAMVDIPHASALLAQGVGRLIRCATDGGVVCVLDSRLAESRYRTQLLDALPPMRRVRDRQDASEFLRSFIERRIAAEQASDATSAG